MVLPFRRYADFRGRSRRKEYWLFILFVTLFYFVVVTAAMTLGLFGSQAGVQPNPVAFISSMGVMAIVLVLFWLLTLIPSIAVSVRRLHDTGRSGWWLLAYVVPYVLSTVLSIAAATSNSSGLAVAGMILSLAGFVAAIVLLVFMVLPGTRGMNRYGADPKDPAGDLVEVFG